MEVKITVLSELEEVSFQSNVREHGHYLGDEQDEESIDIFGSSWRIVDFSLICVRISHTDWLYTSSVCATPSRW